MEIGTDDIDFGTEELYEEESIDSPIEQEDELVQDEPSNESEEDLIPMILKSRGIDDPSKIKFENESGGIDEVDWNTLSTQDKLNILDSSSYQPEEGLDDQEIQLLNTIRQSQLTPAEFLQYMQRTSVENYIQNSQNQTPQYSVDNYNDDELFIMDLLSKSDEITDEEAIEALERAKANDSLFKKQVGAIRNEYRSAEQEGLQQAALQQQEYAQNAYNQFSENVENSILNFKELGGCQLNMSEDDMQDIYTFLTGTDNAGVNWFHKALSDTDSAVQMAWFLLYGEKAIQDINDYYQKEIANVRKQSYDKGVKDATTKNSPTITYKPKEKSKDVYDDLDEF